MKSSGIGSLAVFKSKLGWIAFCLGNSGIQRLTFGKSTRKEAYDGIVHWCAKNELTISKQLIKNHEWIDRIQEFSAGVPDPFLDVKIDLSHTTTFQRQVVEACRAIPYGRTASYGELAAACNSPNAARAVGNVMKTNRVPLIVPCHRVIASGGKLGGYSAPDGLSMKQRLLNMEAASLIHH